jgi:hypothetical protein
MKNLLIALSVSLIVGALTISKIKTIKYYDLAYGEKIEITERDYKILFFKSKGKADIVKSETSKTDYSDAIKYSMLTFGSVLLTLTIINRKKG